MIKKLIFVIMMFLTSRYIFAAVSDDPLLTKVMIDNFEVRNTEGNNPIIWEAESWLGKDLNKLWFKTDGEYVNSQTEYAEVQLLYSRAIAPFWDIQAGWRRDLKPAPTRDWLAISLKGLAPYLFDVDTSVFVGESGQIGARFKADYEYLFTQKLILSPDIEINLHSKDDEVVGVGSGLSDIDLGLRLRYEIRREFAPYIGINWEKKFGKTADFASNEGSKTSDFQVVAGIRAWF